MVHTGVKRPSRILVLNPGITVREDNKCLCNKLVGAQAAGALWCPQEQIDCKQDTCVSALEVSCLPSPPLSLLSALFPQNC